MLRKQRGDVGESLQVRSAVYHSVTMFIEIGHSVPSLASELAVYWALN